MEPNSAVLLPHRFVSLYRLFNCTITGLSRWCWWWCWLMMVLSVVYMPEEALIDYDKHSYIAWLKSTYTNIYPFSYTHLSRNKKVFTSYFRGAFLCWLIFKLFLVKTISDSSPFVPRQPIVQHFTFPMDFDNLSGQRKQRAQKSTFIWVYLSVLNIYISCRKSQFKVAGVERLDADPYDASDWTRMRSRCFSSSCLRISTRREFSLTFGVVCLTGVAFWTKV